MRPETISSDESVRVSKESRGITVAEIAPQIRRASATTRTGTCNFSYIYTRNYCMYFLGFRSGKSRATVNCEAAGTSVHFGGAFVGKDIRADCRNFRVQQTAA